MSEQENILQFPQAETIEVEASLWIARMDTRSLSAVERAALAEWLKRSPFHRETFERMSAVWGGANVLDDLNFVEPLTGVGDAGLNDLSRRAWIGGAIAAGLGGLGLVLVGTETSWFTRTQRAAFKTAVGEQKTVRLVDGSSVIMNTNSRIEVDLKAATRNVRLLQGEAHFQVAKDHKRPFFVYAGSGAIQAVGTAFVVYVRAHDVEVTVSEGVVELFARPEARHQTVNSIPSAKPDGLDSLAALSANENAVFDKKIERVEKLSKEALNRKLLWREGFIGFRGEPLSQVVAEVSRYTNINIEIDDSKLENTPIGGFFVIGDVDGLFDALKTVFQIDVVRIDATHVKLRRQA